MLELLLCSMLTILPDYLYRRFVQGKRLGKEITFFSMWFELRWGHIEKNVISLPSRLPCTKRLGKEITFFSMW